MEIWLAPLLAFVAVALATLSLVLFWEVVRGALRRRDVRRRLRPITRPEDTGEQSQRLYKEAVQNKSSSFDRYLNEVPRLGAIALLMQQAHVGWSVSTFLTLALGFGTALGLAAFVLTSSQLVTMGAGFVGVLLPYMYVRFKRSSRLLRFEENLPESIDLLGRAIRAGHPLSAGVRMVGEDAQEPVAAEFRHLFEEQRFGIPFDEALLGMTDRVDLADVKIFATAVLVQREVGGNLAEILDNIAHTIRARFTIRRQLRVYTAQGRMTGYVLAALPIFVGAGMYALDPSYVGLLFTTTAGRFALIFAGIMQIFGYLWIRQIVNIEI